MRHLRSVPPPGVSPESTGGGGAMPLAPGELASLLEKTSRTFALTIPLLDEPLATDVGLAYLLFRIADTLEDAPSWGRDARILALDSFGEWLVGESAERGWQDTVLAEPPSEDAGCLLLLSRADAVRGAMLARGTDVATSMMLDVVRTSSKMAEFVSRQTDDGGLELVDLPDLRDYCYAVAGIVGELLTEMFLMRDPALEPEREALIDLAPLFGEALQLVNILKDAPSDAREGRVYLPAGVARAEVVALARSDLAAASQYVALLERGGASRNVRAFCELPVRLAEATLDRLDEGATKLSRDEVMAIFLNVTGQEDRST